MVTMDILGNFSFKAEDLADEVIEGIKEDVRKELNGLECPEHQETPSISWGEVQEGIELRIDCCCEELETLAQNKLDKDSGAKP